MLGPGRADARDVAARPRGTPSRRSSISPSRLLLAARAVVARVRLARALAGALPVAVPERRLPCPVVRARGAWAHGGRPALARASSCPAAFSPRARRTRSRACSATRPRTYAAATRGCRRRCSSSPSGPGPSSRSGSRWRACASSSSSRATRPRSPGPTRPSAVSYGHALLDMAECAVGGGAARRGELHFGSTLRARIEALASQRHWPSPSQAVALSLAPVAMLGACSGSTPTAAAPSTTAPQRSRMQDTGLRLGYSSSPTRRRSPSANAAANPAGDIQRRGWSDLAGGDPGRGPRALRRVPRVLRVGPRAESGTRGPGAHQGGDRQGRRDDRRGRRGHERRRRAQRLLPRCPDRDVIGCHRRPSSPRSRIRPGRDASPSSIRFSSHRDHGAGA